MPFNQVAGDAETMEDHFMDSLLADLKHPAIDAFLGAVDEVMNSNTFLLKIRADAPVHSGNRIAILDAFLRDRLFHEMMLAADRVRGWWMFHEVPFEADTAARTPVAGAPGSLVRDGFRLALDPIDAVGMAAHLQWMLTGACSPYRRHLEEDRARDLVSGFLRQVLGPAAGSCPGGPMGTEDRWEFCTVRPDFLRHMDEYVDEPHQPAYFEGCESADTATFFYRDEVFCLLLTNGAS